MSRPFKITKTASAGKTAVLYNLEGSLVLTVTISINVKIPVRMKQL